MAGKGNRKKKTVSSSELNDSVSCIVDKCTVDTLWSSLNHLRTSLGLQVDYQEDQDGENQNLNGVITKLISAVQSITINMDRMRAIQEKQEILIRQQGDEIDEIRQRGLKGSIIVSSLPNPTKGTVSLIKSDDQLRREKMTMHEHVISLIKDKYDVNLPESDIQACHRLPKGTVLLKIWNRKEGSAWESLVNKIKSPENSAFNVYFNFQLTNTRSGLLYECRMLKKSDKIEKFFSDENGQIKLKIKPESNDKVRITYVSKSPGDTPITLTKKELLKLV